MQHENYGTNALPGELVVIGEGEYLQAETAGDFLSVTWSSPDDAAAAVRKAVDMLGDPTTDDVSVFVQLDSEQGEGASSGGSVHGVLEYLETKPALAFVRLTFPDLEFVWGTPQQRIQTSTAAYAEIGVRLHTSAERHQIDALISQTGTDQLKAHYPDVENQIKLLAHNF